MSIVLELQKLAIENNTDVLQLLRKAYLIARKLELTDFESWLDCELHGYKDNSKLPRYRNIRGELKGYNPMRGWIPVVINDTEFEQLFSTAPVSEPIASICELLRKAKDQVVFPLTGSQCAVISKLVEFNTKYSIFCPTSQLSNIIEQVKTEILSWALLLEQNGILGTDITFSTEEKNTAQSNDRIVNYVNYFNGPVGNAQIQQGTSDSEQTIDIE